jgi:uncharacterized protein YqeY
MKIQDKLLQDMKSAIKSGDKVTLETIRMLRADIKNASISKGEDLSESELFSILSKAVKRRQESLAFYKKGDREDLAEIEAKEASVIQSYLPDPLSEKEIEKVIKETIEETGAESLKEMGQVMKVLMPKVQGRANGKLVQEMVKKKLG